MSNTVTYFTGFRGADLLFLAEAAWGTLKLSALSIAVGTALGVGLGWMLAELRATRPILVPLLDVFRSVPLIIQLVLFFNFVPMIGLGLSPFAAGCVVLSAYAAALVAQVARAGIESVGRPLRRAARSLGMSYGQAMRHVVLPMGLRTVFPAWVGIVLGVMKDSSLVSVLGYVELLRASQILITRTQEALFVLGVAGAFYFLLSWPVSWWAARHEKRWQQ
ncbi:amino acid ABC transporter permease [Jhaorihella thermophila]|uniref:Polar amino acid transport system permease protein n=1 Tax=Jhaorihella thermophila TaxID=488547 RepID=A0A1H5UF47_9RHOB|nr:amino acid ABC transporter permease [Jhaorihella thermophila]SEF73693.1 polar amino acid transport system permease protein [Jhaorihella thermophila]